MAFNEEDLLAISGLQHYLYCPRQWALIHLEQQWAESYHTADGQTFHQNAHDGVHRERRGGILTVRGLPVSSHTLGVSGVCDVVEFHRSDQGISLHGEEGLWLPYPVEYKRGRPKVHDADSVQLCCQAMCLEEQFLCNIPEGSLFYGETRRRLHVVFDASLRGKVTQALVQMHATYRRGSTPTAKPGHKCTGCSLKELCLPKINKCWSVSSYLAAGMEEAE